MVPNIHLVGGGWAHGLDPVADFVKGGRGRVFENQDCAKWCAKILSVQTILKVCKG